MSTQVITELKAQPGRGDDVANLLLEILGESLKHESCEAIRILRDQDDPDHVGGLTQWTKRHHYEDYLAWRTARGFTDKLRVHAHRAPDHPLLRHDLLRPRHRRPAGPGSAAGTGPLA